MRSCSPKVAVQEPLPAAQMPVVFTLLVHLKELATSRGLIRLPAQGAEGGMSVIIEYTIRSIVCEASRHHVIMSS